MAGRILGAMIEVRRPPDVETFLAEAGPFLAEREAEHNLLLGICSSLVRDPRTFGEVPPYLAIIQDGGRIVGAAIRTAPYNVVLSEIDDLAAIEPLVRDVHSSVRDAARRLGPGEGGVGLRAGLVRARERERDAGDVQPDLPRGEGDAPERGRRRDATVRRDRSRSLDSLAGRVHQRRRCPRGRSTTPPRGSSSVGVRTRTEDGASGKTMAVPFRSRASAPGRRTGSASVPSTRLTSSEARDMRARSWDG